jgi:hypothetical protein
VRRRDHPDVDLALATERTEAAAHRSESKGPLSAPRLLRRWPAERFGRRR